MYKVQVPYEDFDGKTQHDTLYFHLTKTRLTKNLDLKDDLDDLQQMLSGDERQLGPEEIRKVVRLVERIMKLAYGVRSADGKKFDQRPERWDEFEQTAVYDAFLYSLFEDPQRAMHFIMGVLPKDLLEAAQKEMDQLQLPSEPEPVVTLAEEAPSPPAQETMTAAVPPPKQDLAALEIEELQAELKRRTQQ